MLCATIVLMLLLRMSAADEPDRFVLRRRWPARPWPCIWPARWQAIGRSSDSPASCSPGLLVYDSFTVYFRTLLLFFAVLFADLHADLRHARSRRRRRTFYVLVLGATLGMCLMASANHC